MGGVRALSSFPYHSAENNFERFRDFLELRSRFEFEFLALRIFSERFEFLVFAKFNYMQRDCTCACAVACLHPHNSIFECCGVLDDSRRTYV